MEAILKNRKKGNEFQFPTLMKGDPTHDAEWQPTSEFFDLNGTMNENFYEYIKKHSILEHLWNNYGNFVCQVR